MKRDRNIGESFFSFYYFVQLRYRQSCDMMNAQTCALLVEEEVDVLMGVTLKDVARAAGVSAATVSRVLQDHPRISLKTKEEVRACITSLGYTVNNVARSLKTSRSRTVGFVCPELTNSFFMQVAKGVEDELKQEGYSLIVCNSDETAVEEASRVRLLMAQCVDGIILIPATAESEHLELLKESGIPVVLVDRTLEGFKTDAVLVDNADGSRKATEELLFRGLTRIAYLGGDPHLLTAQERESGFLQAMNRANKEVPSHWICRGDFHVRSGYELMKDIMTGNEIPEAVFAGNYFMYLGAARWLLDEKIRRHRADITPLPTIVLANFDNLEPLSIFGGSDLVVEQPMQELGKTAAKKLLERIDGNREGFPQQIRLMTRLIHPDEATWIDPDSSTESPK